MDVANVDTDEKCKIPAGQDFQILIDENIMLKEKLKYINEKKDELLSKISNLNRKLSCRSKRCIAFKKHYDAMKKKRTNVKEQKNMISKVFSQSQINVLLNKKKVVWSHDDMAMGFTLRHMGSRKCYLYLKNTINIPLPSLNSIQKWAASI